MSVDPHEAERELRDEPPTARDPSHGETIVGDPTRDSATDPEVRDAIEAATEGDRDE